MEEKIKELTNIAKDLGWDIAFPAGDGELSDGNVHGFIIGESAYVNYVLKHLE